MLWDHYDGSDKGKAALRDDLKQCGSDGIQRTGGINAGGGSSRISSV